MSLETINQAYLFLIFIVNGFLIGIVFDIFRILRRSFKTSNYITYLEDIIFWIISTTIVLYSLFIFNNGQFRAYIFIGIFLGIVIYILFFSKYIINISVKIIKFAKSVIIKLFKIILYPIRFMINAIKGLIIKPINKIYKIIIKFFKKLLKKINKRDKILQNKEGI